MTNTGVSVVVCCFNSAGRLPETLSHLIRQRVNTSLNWEILIIDNASKDDTAQVATDTWNEIGNVCSASFKIIHEPVAGLSKARETGIASASYEYILFCDDDNWLCNTYVQGVFDIMDSNVAIGAAGGKGIAVCEVTPPEWFSTFDRPYAVGGPSQPSGPIRHLREFLVGAGMVIRRSAWLRLKEAGFESLLTDRKGSQLSSGGDLEICYALRLAGYTLWYDERLVYRHYIPAERLTIGYLQRLHAGLGSSNVSLDAYQYALNGWNANKRFLWLRLLLLTGYSFIRSKPASPDPVKVAAEKTMMRSYLRELLRLRHKFDERVQQVLRFKQTAQLRVTG